MDEPSAVLQGVSVNYRRVRALQGFDMEVPSRGVHGLLGRNGAGKTTAIRALAGLLSLSGGSVRVLGHDPGENPGIRGRISVLFSQDGLVSSLSVRQNLVLWCGFYGHSSAEGEALSEKALQAFDFAGNSEKTVKDLSTGNRRVAALARVFAVPSELVILDEPTSSLDPVRAAEVRQMISGAAGDRPVLLSTHNLPEAQALCDTITIVHRGRRVLGGELGKITRCPGYKVRALGGSVHHLGITHPPDPSGFVHLESDLQPDRLLEALLSQGNRVTEFRSAGRNLEEVFMGLALKEEE